MREARVHFPVLALALALVARPAPAAEPQPKSAIVAVFPIEDARTTGRLSAKELGELTEYLATKLGEGGAFRIVPSQELRRVLAEKKKESYSTCYSTECQIDVGKELAANKVLVTKILSVTTRCSVLSQLYDLRSSATDRTGSFDGGCNKETLVDGLLDVVAQLKREGRPSPASGDSLPHEIGDTPSDVIVSFSSNPEGALVMLDGTLLCEDTSERCSKIVAAGPHKVTMTKDRYQKRSETLEFKGLTTVHWKLEPDFGTLVFEGSPPRAQAIVNGEPRPILEGSLREERPTGEYNVIIEAPGHFPSEPQTVRVAPDDVARISYDLVPKRAYLKIEATAKVMGSETPVVGDIYIDGTKVGSTPWQGEVLAEIRHDIQLRHGSRTGPNRHVELADGVARTEVIVVPGSWAGATSSVRFAGVPGPWEVRSGATQLSVDEEIPIRPGRIPVEFYFEGAKVRESTLLVSPDEHRMVAVIERPLTTEELDSSREAWAWRRWISFAGAALTSIVAAERLVTARRAESNRDAAYSALRATTVPDELDVFRDAVVENESRRAAAQNVGLGVLSAAVVLGSWTTYEWLLGEPTGGELRVSGLDEVAK